MKKSLPYTFFTALAICFSLGTVAQPPANDNCADAIPVLKDEVVDFSTLDATMDGPFHPDSPCPSSESDSIFSDVWFTYMAAANGELLWSLCGMADFDSRIAVYKAGATCPLTNDDLLKCNEDGPAACTNFESELRFTVVAGQTYLMRLGGFGATSPGAQGSGSFTLTDAPPGPPNNDCADAIEIFLGENQPVSNQNATTDGPIHPNDQVCFGFGDNTAQNDIWFKFVAPLTGPILWSTCDQVNWDSRLVVYGPGATCANASPDNMIGCSDATPGCAGFTNILFFEVTEGETYLLRIGGYNGASGLGVFDLVSTAPPPPPANDLCLNADSVWIMTSEEATNFEFIFPGTIVSSTVSGAITNPSCGGNTGGKFPDVWYKFNSLGNEMIELRYVSETKDAGFYIEILENCDGDTLQGGAACFPYQPADDDFKTDTIRNLAPSTEYYIRASGSLFWPPGVFFFQLVGETTVRTHDKAFPGKAGIYPNPASEQLFLDLDLVKAAPAEAFVINALGQVISQENLGLLTPGKYQHAFDIRAFPAGIYQLVVAMDGSEKTLRFTKR